MFFFIAINKNAVHNADVINCDTSIFSRISNFSILTRALRHSRVLFSYIGNNDFIENTSTRSAFEYRGEYYRVDEVCFPGKPFIVIECGTYDELINNIMDDLDPFPYDLTEAELLKEVKYSLGIEPYPENC